jgi:glutamine amidotransferase
VNKITVVDYGIGNLHSVVSALNYCGVKIELTDSPSKIAKASRLVLPGVGAFRNGMNSLKEKSIINPIRDFIKKGNPLLGICLGMQMLLDESEEFGIYEGFGFISGMVKSIPKTNINGEKHKIPHIGWSKLIPSRDDMHLSNNKIFKDVKAGESVYFLHSFHAITASKEDTLAYCDYNGRKLAAIIASENIYGCQFHPEKSGLIGLKIIENFCKNTYS